MQPKTLLATASIMLLLAIALGAFGAHAWQETLKSHDTAGIFATASQYHFYIALSLFGLAIYAHLPTAAPLGATIWLLISGLILFSGSLYILSLTGIRWMGAITPVGGSLIMIGLGLFIYRLLTQQKKTS